MPCGEPMKLASRKTIRAWALRTSVKLVEQRLIDQGLSRSMAYKLALGQYHFEPKIDTRIKAQIAMDLSK
jgi:hypothetical protein